MCGGCFLNDNEDTVDGVFITRIDCEGLLWLSFPLPSAFWCNEFAKVLLLSHHFVVAAVALTVTLTSGTVTLLVVVCVGEGLTVVVLLPNRDSLSRFVVMPE